MSHETQMLLGLFLGIAIMIFLVMKTKTHTFIALLLAALITGLIGKMSPSDAITAIQDGFGNTLKSTGIIIGLGVMMGGILEKTGAAERMAYSFIKKIGNGKEELALGITGWLVSIPVFADSAIVIFAPLCKAMSRVTGKSVIALALALACGLQCTHVMVPPTPGPLTAAGMMGVDVGQMIIAGALMSVPILIAALLYAHWIGKKIYQIPREDGTYDRKEFKKEYLKSMDQLDEIMGSKKLPGLGESLAPILIPLVLAGYARYLKGIDDNGQAFEPSTDPLLAELQAIVAPLEVKEGEQDFSCLKKLYSRVDVFGVDLYAVGLGEKIEAMAKELFAGPGAVRKTLHKYTLAR